MTLCKFCNEVLTLMRLGGRHGAATVLMAGLLGGLLPSEAFAAETLADTSTVTTQIVLSLDTPEKIPVRTRMEGQPPAVVIEFLGQQVSGSLPERSFIRNGVVSEIQTRYRGATRRTPSRAIESLRVVLTGPYTHRVRTAAGHVILDIEHPASVSGEAIEVGLRGGTILSGLARHPVTERFRVMGEALAKASPVRWTWRTTESPSLTEATPPGTQEASPLAMSTIPQVPVAPTPVTPRPRTPPKAFAPTGVVVVLVLGLTVALLWWVPGWPAVLKARIRSVLIRRPIGVSFAGGESFVEQLVWRAFERQGYQLIRTIRASNTNGTVRIIAREGTKSALWCLVNGPFFEKQTVEQFIQVMRQASMEQGFIVASGSFTVPAQRRAKEANVTLIGREELVELLSAGATTEYFSKQFESLQAALDEARETLRQSAQELDAIRRQRNEASWYLGEERARRAKFEADVAERSQQLRDAELTGEQAQKGAAALRLQWEESRWYLGEAKSRIRYLEEQIAQLQEIVQSVEAAGRDRDAAVTQAGEQRMHVEQLTAQLEALTTELKQSVVREQALQDQLQRYREKLAAIQTHGERRRVTRGTVSEAIVELRDRERQVIFSGGMRDLSGGGIGFETDRAGVIGELVRVSLRIPGRADPIDSRGRLVWQQQDSRNGAYRSGCRFIGLSGETRELIERTIGLSAS